jgi:hypothetical protein
MNRSFFTQISSGIRRITLKRGALFGIVLLGALAAFEIFNYSTTEFALNDLLGTSLRFMGIRWATILSLAFCGIDFAGIARLFTPEQGRREPVEVWYLLGAWLLAAAMNATLTWWGVAVAVRSHPVLSDLVMKRETLVSAVPIFVALMVWVIRVLLIGTFSMAGERMFSMLGDRPAPTQRLNTTMRPAQVPLARPAILRTSQNTPRNRPLRPVRPAPKPEPTYHPVGVVARPVDMDARVRE